MTKQDGSLNYCSYTMERYRIGNSHGSLHCQCYPNCLHDKHEKNLKKGQMDLSVGECYMLHTNLGTIPKHFQTYHITLTHLEPWFQLGAFYSSYYYNTMLHYHMSCFLNTCIPCFFCLLARQIPILLQWVSGNSTQSIGSAIE